MNRNNLLMFIIPTIIILVIVDILIFTFVKDWNIGRDIDVIFINIAFVFFLIAGMITNEGPNTYVFNMSNSVIASVYLALELVAGFALLVFDPETIWHAAIQVVMVLSASSVLIMNISVNRDSIAHDKVVSANHSRLVDIHNIMYDAFKVAKGNQIKKVVENAYDKSKSMSGYTQDGLEEFDNELYDIATCILKNCKEGNDDLITEECKQFTTLCDERARVVRSKQRKSVS